MYSGLWPDFKPQLHAVDHVTPLPCAASTTITFRPFNEEFVQQAPLMIFETSSLLMPFSSLSEFDLFISN